MTEQSAPGVNPGEALARRHTHECSYIIAFYSKNTGNKYPLIGKWTNKLCYTHTIEYYSAMKINKLKLH